MSTGQSAASYYPVESEGGWGPILLSQPAFAAAPAPHRQRRPESDCGGSSSGLGGMNPSKGSDSDSDDARPPTRRVSSKQSGTSSSGKGSSTGASPTSQPPKAAPVPPSPPPAAHSALARKRSAADAVQDRGSQSSGPSTSSLPQAGGHLSDGVSSNGTLKAGPTSPGLVHPGPPHRFHGPPPAEFVPAAPGPPSGCALDMNPAFPPPTGLASLPPQPHLQLGLSANNPPPPPPGAPHPFYTMTVNTTGNFELHPPPPPGAPPQHFAGPPPPPPPHQAPSTSGGSQLSVGGASGGVYGGAPANGPVNASSSGANSGVCGVGGASRASASPPGQGSLATPGLPSFPPLPPNVGHHAVYVHVNLGETLSVRVGNDIQHIQGPATVRMVSGNMGPPVPLPLHVPPGHIVQQIVDQDGTLRHLILSPQHPPPLHPMGGAGFPPSSSPQPGNFVPRAPLFEAEVQKAAAAPMFRAPPNGPAAPRPSEAVAEQRSTSGASNASDEQADCDKIKVFLSRIRAPTVHDIGAREALVHWEALDCTEASATGGPFPYIDSSEFTYEVLVTERTAHARDSWSLGPRIVDGDNEPQQRLTKLRPSTDYTLRVRADLLDRRISGEPSHAVDFKTKPSHPDRPTAPVCRGKTKNSLNIAWKKPVDNGAKITAYKLEMDDVGHGDYRKVYEGQDEKFRLVKLQPNTTYSLRVTAVNACGTSDTSEVFMGHTSGAPPTQPDPPSLLQMTPESLQLGWAKRAGDERFSLQMENPGSAHGFIPVANTTETLTTVKGLAKAREYRFRLLAENEDGKSLYSDAVTFRTAASKPSAPGKPYPKDRVKSSSLRLAWDPPADSGGVQIAQYLLEYAGEASEPKTWTTLYSGELREHLVQALLPGHGYRFRVSCSGEGGGSNTSDVLVLSTTPLPPSPPLTPTLVRAKPNSLQIKWIQPTNTGGAEVTEYEVVMASPAKPNPMDPATVFTGNKQEVTLPNLLPGRAYALNVRAVNRAGPSQWSGELRAETSPGAPDAVSALRVLGEAAPTSVRLEWDPPLLINGSSVSEYRIHRAVRQAARAPLTSVSSETEAAVEGVEAAPVEAVATEEAFGEFTQVWSGSNCGAELRDLCPATAYAFQLRAVNAAGVSSPSEALCISTPPGPPAAPTSPTVEALSLSSLTVSWEVPLDSGSPLTGYRLEVVDGPSPLPAALPLPADACSAVVEGLQPESTYKLRVLATNDIGDGSWSPVVRGSTFSRPPAPPLLELVSAGSGSLKLKWTDAKATTETPTYTLEMENRHGSFSPMLEGTSKSHKVPRLNESTAYAFRVRATGAGGTGPWSETVVFRTLRAAPPALKSPPKVIGVSDDTWQVEWVGVKAAALPKGDRLQYLLELQDGDKWVKKYQGSSQSYTVSGLGRSGEYRVRVSAVRLSPAGEDAAEETVGAALVSGVFSARRSCEEEPAAETAAEVAETGPRAERRLSDSQSALLILVGFSLFAILLAYLLQEFIST